MVAMLIIHQIPLIANAAADVTHTLAHAIAAIAAYAPPLDCQGLPTFSDDFFTKIITWLAKIISGIAVLAIAWSAFQQIQHRDWGKLGGEVIGILVLLLIISKANTIIPALLTMAGISTAC